MRVSECGAEKGDKGGGGAPNPASSASAVFTSSAVPSLQPRSSRFIRRDDAPGILSHPRNKLVQPIGIDTL